MSITKFTIALILSGFTVIVNAQNSTKYLIPGDYFNKSVDLFNEDKFHIARENFNYILENNHDFSLEEVENASYYHALCAIELMNPDAEYLASEYLKNYPASGRSNQLEFETGRYFYRNKKFTKAIEWFDMVTPSRLQNMDRDEYFFSFGYCYFENDSIELARQKFYEIKDKGGKYANSALYYYSHINYTQENYQTALEGFEKLRNDSTFAGITPYYISQIYFLQQKYREVVKYAPGFLEQVTEKRKAEVARIIAESHFNLKQYSEAVQYYRIYAEYSSDMTEEDYYQTGYSLYKAEDYEGAAEIFEKISNNNSVLGQNASYHIADCYIKLNNKQKALVAFSNASKSDYDPRIKEDALFNKAVLNYELTLSPFSESIRDFENYIREYPNSSRTNEAYNYLTQAYLNTKNYEYAFNSLDKITDKNDDVKKAFQQIAFYRGIELMTNNQFGDAIKKFNVSLTYGKYDRNMNAMALYWKGDCHYKLKQYADAIKSFSDFVVSPGAFQMKEYPVAHYNLGYTCFKMGRYNEAQSWFRKFTGFENNMSNDMLTDAYNRAGDIAYLSNENPSAIKFFGSAKNAGGRDVDYALFQKGFVHGLQGEYNQKIVTLEELISTYPKSPYFDDALFETAVSYQALNKLDKAEQYLNRLVRDYHGGSYEKMALVQLGLIYYNANQTEKAISTYKKVIESYPGSNEARNALKGLKNIYIEVNSVENYLSYANNLDGSNKISVSETDSLLFVNAENIYFKGDCELAVVKLNDYITQFKSGSFIKTAYVYLAECLNKLDKKEEAAENYEKVLSLPGIEYNEDALLELSRINYSLERYEKALSNYDQLEKTSNLDANILEAQLGKLRCNHKLKKYNETIDASKKVLGNDLLKKEFKLEAEYFLASSLYEAKKYDEALELFVELSENLKIKEGAEAKYRISEIYFIQGKLDKSEEVIVDFIKLNTPHQYWIAKAYLLWAEIFLKRDDTFQASHTVQSIIDYYETRNDGILSAAGDLKERIADKEKSEKSPDDNDLEINLENN